MNTQYQKMLVSKDINIIDEDERIVEGIITDDLVDIDGHVIDAEGFKAALPDYLQWGNIRDQHGLPVAKVIGTPEWNKFQVQVVDDGVWKKIKAGLYKGFSIGIRVLGVEVEDVSKYADSSFLGLPQLVVRAIKEAGVIIRITKMVLAEVSIVDRPANPRALVTSIKNMKSDENAPYIPVLGNILKAQNQQGEIQMENQNTQVDNQLDETTQETVEKDVTATTENQGTSDVESRIASLEKSVSDFGVAFTDLRGGIETQVKMIQESLEKAMQAFAPAKEEVVFVTTPEVVIEAVQTEQSGATDVAKMVNDLVVKAIADIQAGVTKSVDEAVKKIQVTDVTANERVGGVNGGDGSEEIVEVQKNTTATKKISYREAAIAVAAKFGATIE